MIWLLAFGYWLLAIGFWLLANSQLPTANSLLLVIHGIQHCCPDDTEHPAADQVKVVLVRVVKVTKVADA